MFFLMALTHVSCVLGKETGKKLIWSILKNRHPGVLQISAFKVQLLWSQPCKQWLFPLRTSAIHILGQCLKSLFSESWDLPEMSIWEYSSCKPIVNERDWPLLKTVLSSINISNVVTCTFIEVHCWVRRLGCAKRFHIEIIKLPYILSVATNQKLFTNGPLQCSG